MNPLVKVLRPVVRSRLAAVAVGLHLMVAAVVLAGTPPLTEERWSNFMISGDAAPIAGRAVGAMDQPRSLTVLLLFDFPSAVALFVVNLFTRQLFSTHLQTWSWVNAGFMFLFTFVQWWLLGFAFERLLRAILRPRNSQHATQQVVGPERR